MDVTEFNTDADYNIDSEHVHLMQSHYIFLIKTIDANSGIIDELYSREVLDHRDIDDLSAESSSTVCNEKLLSMLGRKSKEQFEHFLDSLSETGQHHVACKLRGIQSPLDNYGNDICSGN